MHLRLQRDLDSGEMLKHEPTLWQLWAFGILTAPFGLWLWHRQGPYFGLGPANGRVNQSVAYASLIVCLTLIALGFIVGGE
jgi:hypothetical protein